MFLKQIILEGFRSFKERTVVPPFDKGYNVVVGMNGVGKSSLYEAIAFVFGFEYERLSQKVIRKIVFHNGEQQASSIFVELIFDNTDRKITSLDNEFTVCRKLENGKTSKYTLNGQIITRSELLAVMKTGSFFPNSSFYIIKQGYVASTADILGDLKKMIENSIDITHSIKTYQENMKILLEMKIIGISNEYECKDIEKYFKKYARSGDQYTKKQEELLAVQFLVTKGRLKNIDAELAKDQYPKNMKIICQDLKQDLEHVEEHLLHPVKYLATLNEHLQHSSAEKAILLVNLEQLQRNEHARSDRELTDDSTKRFQETEEQFFNAKKSFFKTLQVLLETLHYKRLRDGPVNDISAKRSERLINVNQFISKLGDAFKSRKQEKNLQQQEIESNRNKVLSLENNIEKYLEEISVKSEKYFKETLNYKNNTQKLITLMNKLQIIELQRASFSVWNYSTQLVRWNVFNAVKTLQLGDSEFLGQLFDNIRIPDQYYTALEAVSEAAMFAHIFKSKEISDKVKSFLVKRNCPLTFLVFALDEFEESVFSTEEQKENRLVNHIEFVNENVKQLVNHIFGQYVICDNFLKEDRVWVNIRGDFCNGIYLKTRQKQSCYLDVLKANQEIEDCRNEMLQGAKVQEETCKVLKKVQMLFGLSMITLKLESSFVQNLADVRNRDVDIEYDESLELLYTSEEMLKCSELDFGVNVLKELSLRAQNAFEECNERRYEVFNTTLIIPEASYHKYTYFNDLKEIQLDLNKLKIIERSSNSIIENIESAIVARTKEKKELENKLSTTKKDIEMEVDYANLQLERDSCLEDYNFQSLNVPEEIVAKFLNKSLNWLYSRKASLDKQILTLSIDEEENAAGDVFFEEKQLLEGKARKLEADRELAVNPWTACLNCIEENEAEVIVSIARYFEEFFSRLKGNESAKLVAKDANSEEIPLTPISQVKTIEIIYKTDNKMALSGGQKTLCALALTFAVMKVMPSPFYILDEVDSNLDRCHCKNLVTVLKELSEEFQIIQTTFQFYNMKMADHIYHISKRNAVSNISLLSFEEASKILSDLSNNSSDK